MKSPIAWCFFQGKSIELNGWFGGTPILGNLHIPTYLQNIFWATIVGGWFGFNEQTCGVIIIHNGDMYLGMCANPVAVGSFFFNHQHVHSQMYVIPETHPTCTYFQASLSCNISSRIIFGKSICLSYLNSHLYYLASYLNPNVGWWIPFFICENRTTSMAAAVALMWRWAFSPPLAHRESCVGDGHEVHRWEKEVGMVIILSISGVLYWVYNGLIVFTSRVNALVYLVKLQSYYIYIYNYMYI